PLWRLSRSSAGRLTAAVFPLPVCDDTMRSCPASASGMAVDWTVVGVVMPCSCKAETSSGHNPSVSKDMSSLCPYGWAVCCGKELESRQVGAAEVCCSGQSRASTESTWMARRKRQGQKVRKQAINDYGMSENP